MKVPNPALALALLGVVASVTDFDAKHKGIGGTLRKYKTGQLGQGYKGPLGEPIQNWIQCPGVSVDEFLAECRAPLFRDMWNRWTLLLSTASGTAKEDVPRATAAFMSRLSQVLDGEIRHLEVGAPQELPELLNRQNACSFEMTLRESAFVPAYYEIGVRFVYRGNLTHIPWPAMKRDLKMFASDCPSRADWLLDRVFAPSQEDVPDASTDSPLPPIADPGNTLDPSKPWYGHEPELGLGTEIALVAGGALAVAVLAGYAVRSFR